MKSWLNFQQLSCLHFPFWLRNEEVTDFEKVEEHPGAGEENELSFKTQFILYLLVVFSITDETATPVAEGARIRHWN